MTGLVIHKIELELAFLRDILSGLGGGYVGFDDDWGLELAFGFSIRIFKVLMKEVLYVGFQ